ncbi:MAG TPA: FIST N-terminal domain-containing protein [Thermoleophilaceae bacterium]|nr:FIST N-terminal domain-containing protein [Thermoleophilaceae bacterium]
MTGRVATGLSALDAGADSFAEAADAAVRGLDGRPADLVAVFAGSPNLSDLEEGLATVRERIRPRTLMGCGAQGVVGDGRELEEGGVAVWAASLPGAELESFHLEATPAGEGAVAVSGMPDLDEAEAVIVLVDPYTFPIEPLLGQLAQDHPGLPVIGGLASAGGGPGAASLLSDAEIATHGAVGVAIAGAEVRPCVSQGARPIGPEMVVTAAEGNVIYELASRPALTRLKEAIGELDAHDRVLAARGLLLGIVVDENKPDYERGDFLVRGLLGVDEEDETISLGERVRVGQTVRMQVRDGRSADEDLRAALDRERERLDGPPAGALLFTCNGRGAHMFGHPDHDASALARAFEGAPAAGFFCAGEIGPVGDRSFVHGFTATLAVFGG